MPFLNFMYENLSTIIVLLILCLTFGFVIFSMVRSRKKGHSCCGCADCPMKGKCGSSPQKNDCCQNGKNP